MVAIRITVKSAAHSFGRRSLEAHRKNAETGVCVSCDDWSAQGGEAVQIIGESGSGKSTLLAMVGGYLKPTSGSIITSIHGTSYTAQAAADNQFVACCFQQPMLEPQLTAEENCLIFGLQPREIRRYFVALGIDALRHQRAVELSGGQQRRVSLARALGAGRPLCVVDEPLAGLDSSSCALVGSALDTYCREGNLLVFASHQPLSLLSVERRVPVHQHRQHRP